MAGSAIAKARLIELDEKLKELPAGQGQTVTVQFNPDSLKLAFANQIQNNNPSAGGGGAAAAPGAASAGGSGGGDQGSGTSGRQFVGAGTTKLSVQLWFDALGESSDGQRVDDVRKLTQKVIYFIRPKPLKSDATKFVPPGVRFAWGSFTFDGLIDSIEESIEFFSPEGKPLRASISLGLSQQTILLNTLGAGNGLAGAAGRPALPGTTPLTAAAAGSTLQGLASAVGAEWQQVAAANGIANPRQLVPGQLIDLQARLPRSPF